MAALTYFAADGSYGMVSGIIIVDTSAWNEDDWDRVENAGDHERAAIAASIAAENGDI